MWDVTARGSLLPDSEAAYLGTLPAYSLPRVNNAGEMRYFLVHRWGFSQPLINLSRQPLFCRTSTLTININT